MLWLSFHYTTGVSSSQRRALQCGGIFINSSGLAVLVIYGKLIPVVCKTSTV